MHIRIDRVNWQGRGFGHNLSIAKEAIESGECPDYIDAIDDLPKDEVGWYVCPK